MEWYEGKQEIVPGQPVKVIVPMKDLSLDIVLKQARQTFRYVQVEGLRLQQAAVGFLLVRYNQLRNDVQLLDANDLTAQLTLTTLAVYEDGSAEIIYEGSMFLGSTCTIDVDKDGFVWEACVSH